MLCVRRLSLLTEDYQTKEFHPKCRLHLLLLVDVLEDAEQTVNARLAIAAIGRLGEIDYPYVTLEALWKGGLNVILVQAIGVVTLRLPTLIQVIRTQYRRPDIR